jgi:hypothetical protein
VPAGVDKSKPQQPLNGRWGFCFTAAADCQLPTGHGVYGIGMDCGEGTSWGADLNGTAPLCGITPSGGVRIGPSTIGEAPTVLPQQLSQHGAGQQRSREEPNKGCSEREMHPLAARLAAIKTDARGARNMGLVPFRLKGS